MAIYKEGSRGPQVLQIQRMLITLGINIGEADGKFGPRTDAGVRSFQQSRKLTVDGRCGTTTLAHLKLAVAALAEKPDEREQPVQTGDFKYNERSLKNLAQCHPDLQKMAAELEKIFPVVVTTGHRNKADQDAAVRGGYSKAPWPKSRHNTMPSTAFDAYPHPIPKNPKDWDDPEYLAKFAEMRRQMKVAAARAGVSVEFLSWDRPHVQLVKKKAA